MTHEERFVIIGTAGHVDHGKTQLVKALTGVDTDRLKEEKERGISIELGFAPLPLPSGSLAGVVDVPGHERFVKNMLAGAGGIDLVLFVVAADEGVMPQTREHLDILNLLGIQKAVVALTKVDLVDEEWLLLVEEDVRSLLKGTRFEDAPFVRVSVVTGEGLEELVRLLDEAARAVTPKPASGSVRLPVDRVFSVAGFGTVVTGTLFSGKIRTGDVLELLPRGLRSRARSLQVHGRKVEEARAGQRVAINLTGVEVEDVERGDVVVTPGAFATATRLTVLLRLLPAAGNPLKNWQRVRFHLGTKEAFGRVRLLDREELPPGEECFAQLELEEPVVAVVHDRFVIRAYSPIRTIGGGEVLEVGGARYRRFRPEVLARLEHKLSGGAAGLLLEELRRQKKPLLVDELAVRTGLEEPALRELATQLAAQGEVVVFDLGGEAFLAAAPHVAEWEEKLLASLEAYHARFPLRPGIPKEELRTRLFAAFPPKLYQALLEGLAGKGKVELRGQAVARAGFEVRPTPEQEEKLRRLLEQFRSSPFSPPTGDEILKFLHPEGEELVNYCLQEGVLVKVGEGLYFLREALEEAWRRLEEYLRAHGEITVAAARDLLGTTRRFCLPLLEYFDRERRTRRLGDKRVLFRSPS